MDKDNSYTFIGDLSLRMFHQLLKDIGYRLELPHMHLKRFNDADNN